MSGLIRIGMSRFVLYREMSFIRGSTVNIVKCNSRLGNPVENYSELSELYRGKGFAANVRYGHSNVRTSASNDRHSLP